MPLDEFARLHRQDRLPPDAIAVTFDDGYADNAEVAAPLLHKFNIPATIFLPVEWMERGEPFWWDEIRSIVLDHDRPTLRLGSREFRLGEMRSDDRQWKHNAPPLTPRQLAFQRIWVELLSRKPEELERAVAELRAQCKPSANAHPLPPPMTKEQIRALSAQGVSVGSHTLRHPNLNHLSTAARRREIVDSIDRCEALSGSRPTSFAYPYGIFDEQSEELVVRAGFTCACSTERAAVSAKSRSHALPRLQVGSWPARKLAVALNLL